MLDVVIPDLTLQGLPLGPKEESVDLRRLLYKGAPTMHQCHLTKAIESGHLGRPQSERLPLLEAVHKKWQADISAKTLGRLSIENHWKVLKSLFGFAETTKMPLTVSNAMSLYLAFCAHTKRRDDIKAGTKYSYSQTLASIIASVLGMDARKLQWKTKIRNPKRLGNQAAKEKLDSTATFVQVMIETAQQLSVSVIRGPLPVTIRFDTGAEYSIHCGIELKPVDSLKSRKLSKKKRALDARERRTNDTSHRARAPLINLRLDAELLIFINQTACNLTQALQLTGSQFRYQSEGDYLHLFVWKNRAKHEIELRIHKAYRPRFEAYLKWRAAIFPDDPDGLTFPFVWNDGDKAMRRTGWAFQEARKLTRGIGQPFVHSQQLRKTAGNFMKRRVSRQAAAELLSNTEKTFRECYEETHHQSASRELVSFWRDAEALVSAVGPGGCQEAKPKLRDDAPEGAPKPDCEGGGGCLFCDKNRDLRSFDHAWNLASFHHLKLAELNADRTPLSLKMRHPVALVIERVAAKLNAISELGDEGAEWVTEAWLRVKESRYHPYYTAAFTILEGAQ
ncbi:hypothetical protein HFP05_00755 [Rhodanobacter denitrificans]|nr:hypothetical protein [Rhodanobacter denitrificans]